MKALRIWVIETLARVVGVPIKIRETYANPQLNTPVCSAGASSFPEPGPRAQTN